MNRRSVLALPLLAALPSTSWAASSRAPSSGAPSSGAAPAWSREVSEIRYGGSGPATPARARALQARLGVPVRAVVLPPAALALALNRGALECATLSPGAGARAVALMGERLLLAQGIAVRRALPGTLGIDLARALTTV